MNYRNNIIFINLKSISILDYIQQISNSLNPYQLTSMFLGQFAAYLFPTIAFFAGTLAIIICYWLSQILHHEKPFPDTWISATADHYPQYIVFRIGTITGSVFLALSHVLAYFWICQIARENAFNIAKYRPGLGTMLGMTGAMFLMGSTANLDTGDHNTQWHVFCAGNFFLWSIISMWYYTAMSVVLYTKLKAGGKISVIAKTVLSVLILLQAILSSLPHPKLFQHNRVRSSLDNILEYTIAFSILVFFPIMAYDLRKFKMAYVSSKK